MAKRVEKASSPALDREFRYREKHVVDITVGSWAVRAWNPSVDRDGDFRRDIALACLPLLKTGLVYPYIAMMADFHPGEGAMIGSVIPTRNVLFLSVMGGDLGCGMCATPLGIPAGDMSPWLAAIRNLAVQRIPTGGSQNSQITERVRNHSLWDKEMKAPVHHRLLKKLERQFASLGGGNHFIEVQEDSEGLAWIMLHSGSRFLGVRVRDYYIETGKHQEGVQSKTYDRFPHLMVGTPLAEDYLADLALALEFARLSRREMMLRTIEVCCEVVPCLKGTDPEHLLSRSFDKSHNFVAPEVHFGQTLFVHRKGATRAFEGEIGMIPGSMGSRSYIVEGRGNPFSFGSCSHGAGRRLPRAEALSRIGDRAFAKSMENIMFQFDSRLRDEAPMAYKDIDRVMRAQKDLVKIRHELRPLLSIKGIA